VTCHIPGDEYDDEAGWAMEEESIADSYQYLLDLHLASLEALCEDGYWFCDETGVCVNYTEGDLAFC